LPKSLYERLGGYDAIAAFVTDYVRRLRADRRFDRFGGGRGSDSRERSLQLNIDYMCKVTGGSHYYLGRDMKTAHRGLGITEEDWGANLKHMSDALAESGVSAREQGEVLAILSRMKKDFVEK
jgi:hemoglobin